MTENQVDQICSLLASNRGKIFGVKFTKKDGSTREMLARQGVKNGTTPLKGGKWANGNAGKSTDHRLVLCTDIEKEKEGKHSRRSFTLDSVVELSIAGKKYTF